MSKKQRTILKFVSPFLMAGLLLSVVLIRDTPVAIAHIVPSPCDFTTGGGFFLTDSGNHANFGLVGGCKNGGFFGHFNFVDHDTTNTVNPMCCAGLHVNGPVSAYFEPAAGSNVRDLCGTANTNLFGTVKFRARTEDNADPNPGGRGVDKFGLKLTGVSPPFTGMTQVIVSTRLLAGGDIELHKPNPSTTGPSTPPDEITACGSDDSGLGT
jgi:hypothetical protein